MRTKASAATLALALALLAGCATDGETAFGEDSTWGEANRQTFAAQVIDPAPEYDTAVAQSSGKHAADAIERYRKGTIKLPVRIDTGKGISGSSGQ